MTIEACLPAHLHGSGTTITTITTGLSGAGVYRVEAAGQAFALKISSEDEPLASWRCARHEGRGAPAERMMRV